jgi:hypothetical protein
VTSSPDGAGMFPSARGQSRTVCLQNSPSTPLTRTAGPRMLQAVSTLYHVHRACSCSHSGEQTGNGVAFSVPEIYRPASDLELYEVTRQTVIAIPWTRVL